MTELLHVCSYYGELFFDFQVRNGIPGVLFFLVMGAFSKGKAWNGVPGIPSPLAAF
jgi:hypothetical protein